MSFRPKSIILMIKLTETFRPRGKYFTNIRNKSVIKVLHLRAINILDRI